MSAQHSVVGSWRVAVDVEHVHGPINLALLSADGTVLVAFPSPTPAAPGAGHQLEYWTPAVGSWQPSGDHGATMRFEALGVDEHGAAIGTHTIAATVETDSAIWRGHEDEDSGSDLDLPRRGTRGGANERKRQARRHDDRLHRTLA